jgi:hypothetical protein
VTWYATAERVAAAWLAGLPGFSTAMVGTELPDGTAWASTGFLVVTTVGGSSEVHIPLEHPRVSVQCYAVSPDTGVPPWNAAGNLAAAIGAACQAPASVEHLLTLPNCDQGARLLSAYTTTIPRRTYGDVGDYACVVVELALHWTTH